MTANNFSYVVTDILPQELVILILDFLDKVSIFALSRTSKQYFQNKIIESYNKLDMNTIRTNAVENGHTNLFEWLVPPNEIRYGMYYMKLVCEKGHLDILTYLHKNGCDLNISQCAAAAGNGHLYILQYLHENGCHWGMRVCYNAVCYGDLDILKYLHANKCPWDEDACFYAAIKGHLNVLKYLHENGCPWDNTICYGAAEHGNLEILQYLHENGCPWDKRVLICAVRSGGKTPLSIKPGSSRSGYNINVSRSDR